MSRYLNLAVFLLGLAAVCWIGAGYVASNPLALCMTLLVGVCYVAGALELRRYDEATATLTRAVTTLSAPPPALDGWLDTLHPGLRNPVRLRIEGERVALAGPALAPYLVGLLVLLGMLGTLLGMVATLRGTGMALESATDLQAIRASLAAPVKGLGFAFGTSIAGVATSAMLGLLSALCRRERIHAAQLLDVQIATRLRGYSLAHRRDESFRLLQRQADLMPTLVDRLQAMTTAIEQQSLASNQRQLAGQDAFHARTEAAYTRLASSVEQSLKASVAESARTAGAALQPVVEATMAGLARDTAALHGVVTEAVQRQLDGLTRGFETNTATVADLWRDALAGHQLASDALTQQMRGALEHFTDTFEQRSASWLENVGARLDTTTDGMSAAWNEASARQQQAGETLAARHEAALTATVARFEQHSDALLHTIDATHAERDAQSALQDQQRLAAWTESLGAVAATLSREWQQVGEQTATRQQAICDTLARTAEDMSAQTHAHAGETIAEIGRLVQAASEAPKAAADVVAELRQKLSDSMVRDTAMLDERARLLATLETLLDAVNHASTEQRSAVDGWVAASADLLERIGSRFAETVDAETGKLGAVAAQVTGSAVEVASLGEAFGAAVQMFGESNSTLIAHLQRLESALDRSATRSDEQLAYYVAQAREVVDLSVLSQKQIVDDLQQLAGRRAAAGADAA